MNTTDEHVFVRGSTNAVDRGQGLMQWQGLRGYAAKDLEFGTDARARVLVGVEKLAAAVSVTLGPKVCMGLQACDKAEKGLSEMCLPSSENFMTSWHKSQHNFCWSVTQGSISHRFVRELNASGDENSTRHVNANVNLLHTYPK